MKKLYIAEKPSVAQEFAKALKIRAARKDGYLEGEEAVVTWCVGHLVTMSYPEMEPCDASVSAGELSLRSDPGDEKAVQSGQHSFKSKRY